MPQTEVSSSRPPEWVCPHHNEVLEASESGLLCPRGEIFPVDRGVPRFVDSSHYAAAFGAQWKRYRKTQLDSYSGTTITADRARRCLGEELWSNLDALHVLECGCGAGRFTEILLARGAHVTSIDLSEAVDANHENFPTSTQHRIAQADILNLPFRPCQYDVVFCLGTVQHTPDPEETIETLYRHVRPGGWLIVDHYAPGLSRATRVGSLVLRQLLRRLSPDRSLVWTERLVDLFLPWHRRASRIRPLHRLLTRLSPVMAYYAGYPELPDALQKEWALLDTHDSLTDRYKHLRTPRQIRRALHDLMAIVERCERAGNGVEARARRPG